MAYVQRLLTLLAAGVVFAAMFGVTLTIQMGLAAVSPQIWLLPLLAIVTTTLWGLAPHLKAIEDRAGLFLAHASGLLLAFLASNDLDKLSEGTSKVLRAGTIGLWVVAVLGTALATLGGSARARPAMRWALLACLVSLMVAYFSGSEGGAGSWVAWIEAKLHLSRASAENAVFVMRKTLHFSFYATLAWLPWRVARLGGASPGLAAWIAVGFAGSFAMFDEFRQRTSPGRMGSPWDVALDLSGVAFVLAVSAARARR